MIKIRYADLPAGIHVRAEAAGRDIVIYLLPGLTPAQRRSALRRARSSARIGHGPALSAAGLARAIAADRARLMARNSAAALRAHPALFVPPMIVLVSAALASMVLGSVPGARLPAAQNPFDPVGMSVLPQAHPGPAGPGPGRHGRRPGSPGPARPGRTARPAPSPSASQGGAPGPSPTRTPRSGGSPGTGSSHRPPGPFRSVTPTPSPSPARSQTASPAPASPAPGSSTGSGSGSDSGSGPGGACLDLGPLGVCLDA